MVPSSAYFLLAALLAACTGADGMGAYLPEPTLLYSWTKDLLGGCGLSSTGFVHAARCLPRSCGRRATQVHLDVSGTKRSKQQLSVLTLIFWFVATLTAIAADEPGAPGVKRVLVVYADDSALPAVIEFAKGLREGLEARSRTRLELYSEYLDIVRFPSPDHLRRFEADLAAKYADVHLDVVMAVGRSALQFMLKNRARIASGAPLIFGGVTDDELGKDQVLPPDVRGVLTLFDVRKTIDLARQLQPTAKRVIVLTGSADYDRRLERIAHETLGAYSNLQVEYLSGLTMEGFKQKVKQLPADAILLILTVYQDAAGVKLIPREAASEIAAASGAPSYGIWRPFLGAGILGGYIVAWESVGRDVASLTDQYLIAASPTPQIIHSEGALLLDWRQMRRWGIDESRLPQGAKVLFYEPTIWERHRALILATLTVVLLQAATIAALILQGRHRRRTEQELALERLELAHLSRRTQLGELSAAFAHELNQPLTSILANAQTGARLLRTNPPDMQELEDIFGDIVEEDKRAAGVIAQLRRLMAKGEAKLDPMNLNEAVTSTMALARSELIARQTKCQFDREQPELPVRGNLVQLEQVILNLILNATDAMAHLAPTERRIAIATRIRDDGFRELAISDRGHGLSPEMRSNAFKPFVSTKAKGLGMGLAICHSIALAHGGSLTFDEHKTDGARVILALPPA
jgi:signal transduction histidine kinase